MITKVALDTCVLIDYNLYEKTKGKGSPQIQRLLLANKFFELIKKSAGKEKAFEIRTSLCGDLEFLSEIQEILFEIYKRLCKKYGSNNVGLGIIILSLMVAVGITAWCLREL